MIFLVILIALLALCAIMDLRSHQVHWKVFPGILAATIAVNWEFLYVENILLSAAYLSVILLALMAYLILRNGKIVNLTKEWFAWGDILFLIAMIPLFSFQWYMAFFVIGTSLSLVFHLIRYFIKPQKKVPYAGYMAIVGILYLCFKTPLHTYFQLY